VSPKKNKKKKKKKKHEGFIPGFSRRIIQGGKKLERSTLRQRGAPLQTRGTTFGQKKEKDYSLEEGGPVFNANRKNLVGGGW